MKKSLLALAFLGSFAGIASAQTSVTLYGIVDVGYSHESGNDAAGSVNGINSGLQSPSRIGFKGAEKINDSLSAIFQLENGFNTDDGSLANDKKLFDRQAYAGLQGNFGVVKLGRQYNPLYNATSPLDPFGVGLAGDYTHLISVGDGSSKRRVDNSVTYATPSTLGGFKFEGLYGFGEQAGDSAKLRQVGFSTSYTNGPIYATLAYNNAKDVTGLLATKNIALGGAYTLGAGVKLSALYQTNKNDAALDTRDWMIGASVPFGANTFMASYIRHLNRVTNNADSSQIALGYSYSLSKRTNFYTSISRLTNDNNAAVRVATPGDNDNLFNAGIRHIF